MKKFKSTLNVNSHSDERKIIWESCEIIDKSVMDALVKIVIKSINLINKEFHPNKLHNSIKKYFFFPGIDDDDLFDSQFWVKDYLRNIRSLEDKIMKSCGIKDCEIYIKAISFERNMDLIIDINAYIETSFVEIQIKKKKVEIYIEQ